MNYKSQVTWKETDLVKGGMSGKKNYQTYQNSLNASHLPSWLSFFISSPSVLQVVLRTRPPKSHSLTIILNYTVRQNPVLSLYNAIKSNLNPLAKFKINSTKSVKGVHVIFGLVLKNFHIFAIDQNQ